MRSTICLRSLLLALALIACSLVALPASAGAAAGDPLFIYRPLPPPLPPPIPPPAGQLEGPCGVAVEPAGDFYVSDYYHHAVDVLAADTAYIRQLANEDPLDGPCGLALGPAGNLYVNNFHRNVVRFGPASGFGVGTVIAGAGVDASHPTGVAVDGAGTVYVDERDHVATFDAAGVEGEPIGLGSLTDAYGVAVSAYPATAGFIYVPDAADQTVKVYDPARSRTVPVDQIDGSATPLGRFVSLRDAAIAVDDVTGTVYVVDDLTPGYKEGHEAVVYAFGPTGTYLGRLKYAIQAALPAGLAVDNSAGPTQGRVYVTSGYTELAEVYVYPPGSAGSAAVGLSSAASPITTAASAPPPAVTSAASPTTAPAAAPADSSESAAPQRGPAAVSTRHRLGPGHRIADARRHHDRRHRHPRRGARR